MLPCVPLNRQQQLAWRQEDLVQRQLDNARAVWERYVEKNRCGEILQRSRVQLNAGREVRLQRCGRHAPTCAGRPPCARSPAARRRDVEERAEQLKAISNLSALIAGFALVR